MVRLFSGSGEINVDGKKAILEPFQQVYVAGTNIPHGFVILSQETVLGFEMKYLIGSQLDKHIDEPIISLQPTIDKTIGFPYKFGACSWFHIAILEIPANDKLPKCTTNTEEIGIIFNEQIMMKVGEEEKLLEYGSIYYAPAGVSLVGIALQIKQFFKLKFRCHLIPMWLLEEGKKLSLKRCK